MEKKEHKSKVEAPKVEAPKVEAPKVEAPKVEALKTYDRGTLFALLDQGKRIDGVRGDGSVMGCHRGNVDEFLKADVRVRIDGV